MEMMLGLGLFIYAMIFGIFVLWVWALIDIITSKFQEDFMQVIWLLVVFFLPFIGVLLYLLVGKSMKRANDVIQEDLNQKYDQLAKIKELLDAGAISQDEFDAEKQKILNRTE
ncbi:MAG: SHOCT domain-containing protein [Sulfuricurvum sp.]|jgi:membrane protein implicated in regulation of membrane protease activity